MWWLVDKERRRWRTGAAVDDTDGTELLVIGSQAFTTMQTQFYGAEVQIGTPTVGTGLDVNVGSTSRAFSVAQNANDYIVVNAAVPEITFGDAHNPDYTFVGTGPLTVGGEIHGPSDGTGIVIGHLGIWGSAVEPITALKMVGVVIMVGGAYMAVTF